MTWSSSSRLAYHVQSRYDLALSVEDPVSSTSVPDYIHLGIRSSEVLLD